MKKSWIIIYLLISGLSFSKDVVHNQTIASVDRNILTLQELKAFVLVDHVTTHMDLAQFNSKLTFSNIMLLHARDRAIDEMILIQSQASNQSRFHDAQVEQFYDQLIVLFGSKEAFNGFLKDKAIHNNDIKKAIEKKLFFLNIVSSMYAQKVTLDSSETSNLAFKGNPKLIESLILYKKVNQELSAWIQNLKKRSKIHLWAIVQ